MSYDKDLFAAIYILQQADEELAVRIYERLANTKADQQVSNDFTFSDGEILPQHQFETIKAILKTPNWQQAEDELLGELRAIMNCTKSESIKYLYELIRVCDAN
jgi:hypothetical protein